MEFSGRTSAYEHKHNYVEGNPLDPSTPAGIRKVWFLDAQWSTCPTEVEEQVKDLWRLYDCGNDHYIIKMDMSELIHMDQFPENYSVVERWTSDGWVEGPIKVDAILAYARQMGVGDDENLIIHWWW